MSREQEWDEHQRALMLAHVRNVANVGPHGIPMDVATDVSNQFKFVADDPIRDFAAKALAVKRDAYYEKYYTSRGLPIQSEGDLWTVHLKK